MYKHESTHVLIEQHLDSRDWTYETLLRRMPGAERENIGALEDIETQRHALPAFVARRLARALGGEARWWLEADRAFHAQKQRAAA